MKAVNFSIFWRLAWDKKGRRRRFCIYLMKNWILFVSYETTFGCDKPLVFLWYAVKHNILLRKVTVSIELTMKAKTKTKSTSHFDGTFFFSMHYHVS